MVSLIVSLNAFSSLAGMNSISLRISADIRLFREPLAFSSARRDVATTRAVLKMLSLISPLKTKGFS